VLGMLKGKTRIETTENYLIATIFVGAIILSLGMGLTVLSPKGLSVILAMLGSLITFASTVLLILVWLVKELKGE